MSGRYNPQPGRQPAEQPPWSGYGRQESYLQAGYQQSGYQQPQGGYSYPQQESDIGHSERIRVIGLLGAAVGAALLIAGFTTLAWYRIVGRDIKFSDFHKALRPLGAPAFPKADFGWLGWLLLAAVVVSATLASLPIGSLALTFRIVAPAAAVIGIVVTLLALNSYWNNAKTFLGDVSVFKHSAVGLYVTLIGFLVAGLAGLFGPRRT